MSVGKWSLLTFLIQKSRHIKYLGANLDERLTFNDMIDRKCRTAMDNLQKLKLVRKRLILGAAQTISLGLVISHLDYANAHCAALLDTDERKKHLQIIQNYGGKNHN